MAEYDFSALSDFEFEQLTRDLLQAEWGIVFESFTTGRDSGIDLRHYGLETGLTIVQCKHMIKSAYTALVRKIRSETHKIERIAPNRYVIVTSMPLTPHRKDELIGVVRPLCRSEAVVFGREDLNNLLGRHPDVERRYIKLWLNNTLVLERLLHSGFYNDTTSELHSIRQKLSKYVPNPSYDRASSILEAYQFCIIKGAPGIGKTTLAEMLLLSLAEREFEIYRIWDDVGEARKIFDPSRKQVFYYDDFLGRTGLKEKLLKNEDERLLRFVADVRRSPSSRIILTTRNYIFNQARSTYEALYYANLDFATCTVSLEDYTDLIRAQILYNHLYFSEISFNYIFAVVRDRRYMQIIHHRNFNPRIIEQMTDPLHTQGKKPGEFVAHFINSLNTPRRIWEMPFTNHLSDAAKDILLVMTSAPDYIAVSDLERAFDSFRKSRSKKYRITTSPYDFKRGLSEIERTFIIVEHVESETICQFHDPSVRDFLESHLQENVQNLSDLVQAAVAVEQLVRLWSIYSRIASDARPNEDVPAKVLAKWPTLFSSPPLGIMKIVYRADGEERWTKVHLPVIRSFLIACEIARTLPKQERADHINSLSNQLLRTINTSYRETADLVLLITNILSGLLPGLSSGDKLFESAMDAFLEDIENTILSLDEFKAIERMCRRFPGVFDGKVFETIQRVFEGFYDMELNAVTDEDPEMALAMLEDLERVATGLSVDITHEIGVWRRRVEREIDSREGAEYPSEDGDQSDSDELEIDTLFQNLLRQDEDT